MFLFRMDQEKQFQKLSVKNGILEYTAEIPKDKMYKY
jgi:hypothetical protein